MKTHACLMTMNELLDLVQNLSALLPYVDTVTVVDGGSTDGTIPYMRNWSRQEPRVRFFIHPWKDNFPAQRNNYLARVAEIAVDGDWIVAVDPDEVLDKAALVWLRDIARVVSAKPEGFARVGFRCRSVSLRASDRVHQQEDDHWKGLFFRWSPHLHYTHHGNGPVHEILSGADPMYCTGHHPEFPTLFYEHRKQENVIWPRGCFPPGERIIAEHGYLKIEDVREGDLVLGGDGRLHRVTEVMQRTVNEKIVEIRAYGSKPLRLTQEHPVWAAVALRLCPVDSRPVYKKGSGPAHKNKGQECCSEDVTYTNFAWVNAAEINKRHIVEFPQLLPVERRAIPPLVVYDGGNQRAPQTREVPLTPDLCRLLGYWLAEGHFEKGKIGFSFSVYEQESLVADLAEVAARELRRTLVAKEPKGNSARVEFSCSGMDKWMRVLFGSGAPNKRIPLSFIAALSVPEKAALLKGLWLGDGTRSDYHYTLSVASPHLAMAAWLIALELGLRPSLSEIRLETLNRSNNGFKHKHPMFRVTIPKQDTARFELSVLCAAGPYFKVEGRTRARPSKPEANSSYAGSAWFTRSSVQSALPSNNPAVLIPYKGVVHNIEVDGAHSYCTPYMIVHNCRNYFCGGGGPNLGSANPRWVEMRAIAGRLGISTWHQMHAYLIGGGIAPELKDWIVRYRQERGWDGSSEQREWYKTYFRLYHPEEEPAELRGESIE